MQKRNVIFLCSSLSNGGAERVLSILSQALSKDYNITLLLFDGSEVSYQFGGKLVDLKFKKTLNKIKKIIPIKHLTTIIALFFTVIKIRKIKKALKPYCSISLLETPNITNILSSIGEKVVVSVRSTRSLQKKSMYEKLENKGISLYKKAYRVVSISEGVKEDLIKNFNIPKEIITTIYNPYQLEKIRCQMNEEIEPLYKHFFDSHTVIAVVGRLIKDKNQERLLRCISRLKEQIPNIGCVIIGSGERYEYLKGLVSKLDITENVLFIPFTNNPFKYVYRSKLYVSTSEREGFGNTIIEAMICGLPIIAVDCLSGPREIIANRCDYGSESFNETICSRGILIPLEKNDKTMILDKVILRVISDERLKEEITRDVKSYIETLSTASIILKWKFLIES